MEKIIAIGSGLALCAISFIGGFNTCRKVAIENVTKNLLSEETKTELNEILRSEILKGIEP